MEKRTDTLTKIIIDVLNKMNDSCENVCNTTIHSPTKKDCNRVVKEASFEYLEEEQVLLYEDEEEC
jgi:uncharacterized glyoxalase superfamily metalloenzyme YdcJ